MMASSEPDRLNALADAYGVLPSLDDVAEAIMTRIRERLAIDEREAVLAVVERIVRDEGTMAALRSDREVPELLRIEMNVAVRQHRPVTPSATLVQAVLGDVRAVLDSS